MPSILTGLLFLGVTSPTTVMNEESTTNKQAVIEPNFLGYQLKTPFMAPVTNEVLDIFLPSALTVFLTPSVHANILLLILQKTANKQPPGLLTQDQTTIYLMIYPLLIVTHLN